MRGACASACALFAVFAAPGAVPQASAQMSPISAVSAVGVRTGEDALGTMLGVGFTTMSPLGRTSESPQLSGFVVGGSRTGFGSPCAGLIRPGTCPQQPLRTTSRMGVMSIALAGRVYKGRALQVHLAAGPSGGFASTNNRGTVTGETLRGSKGVWGGTGGLDAFWWPGTRSSLGVHLGLAVTGLRSAGIDCVDCYIPFGEGFVLTRAQVGVSFGRARP